MATFAGLLSKDTTLSYKDGETSKTVAAVKTVPAMGSDPEKIEVTHLGSAKKAYIAGIQDTDNLEFAIVYQGDNFKDIDTLVKTGKSVDWTVTYPDGMKSEFTGQPSYKLDGAEVNQAIGFNLVIVVSEGPDITPSPR
ncbi:phage tail protein [Lactococcus lactis]|uniref:phage tail protein n=1 Tax=Lactococcus lactis TaxID=1358 RepID=UPI0022E459D5|nr:phage tail protein [Lactococcus lactis]